MTVSPAAPSPGSHPHPAAGEVWLTTERLVLRRPVAADLDDYVRLHTDPRTYAHAPTKMPTADGCAERLSADLASWAEDGVGYAAVLDRSDGRDIVEGGDGAVVGWAGLRLQQVEGRSFLNLYYRLAHDRLGRGYGKELARAVVAWATEWRPDLPVSALVAQVNTASLATAESAGLRRIGFRLHADDPPGSVPMVELESPTVAAVADIEHVAVDELLDLWLRVNDAGGAVGFVPGAPRADVAEALDSHLEEMGRGRAVLVTLREPTSALLGFGFWLVPRRRRQEHVAGLVRLMVEPDQQGRNLGRLLLSGMVGVARRELPGIRLLRLDYRGGQGLGAFYEANGWVEVGREAGGIWLGGDAFRDDVAMARRVDGAPLVPDGGY